MSKIKLTGSNSGYVEISSAADAGNLTLTLPTSGTALLSNGDNVYTGITTFSNDLKLEGGSYNVLWDASDNQLEFDDNAKLSFGNSSDLQLYHDGTYNRIAANGQIFLQNKAANETYFAGYENGRVELYWDNSIKLTTETSGVNITGILTATHIVQTSAQLSHRNKVINGAMRFSQRATSFTSTLADTQYILDRFTHIIRGTNDSYYYQVTDHPEGFSNSMKVSPNSTHTPSASDNAGFQTYIEGQDLQDLNFGSANAKTFTVSFYAKSASQNNGHQYTFQIRSYPSSGTTRIKNYPFTVTTSWQRYSFTFTGDTGADIANTHGAGMAMLWNLNAGPDDIASQYTNWTTLGKYMCVTGQSNFLDNTNNEFYLTGVQLEVGSVATPFEHRSYGEELRLCQRYFYKVQGDQGERVGIGGCAVNTTEFRMNVTFPVAMRQLPGISGTGTAQMDAATDSANFNCSAVTIESAPSPPIHSLGLQAVTSGMVAGQGGNLRFRSNGSSLSFSAEF